MARRPALNAERIISAAVAVADERGLAGVSMRNVAAELGVEAMSLYHHIASKDALIDGLADHAFELIELPPAGTPWREAMVVRAISARTVLSAHPWALGLLESRRNPGPAVLAHHDGVLGVLRADGFPLRLALHAFSVLDAYVYGFVLTEVNLPFGADETAEDFVDELRASTALEAYPNMLDVVTEHVVGGGYDFGDEFEYGLDLILDGLEQRVAASRR